jgi:hypothetical protein
MMARSFYSFPPIVHFDFEAGVAKVCSITTLKRRSWMTIAHLVYQSEVVNLNQLANCRLCHGCFVLWSASSFVPLISSSNTCNVGGGGGAGIICPEASQ